MSHKSIQHTTPIPLIYVSGTHREMGRQIGSTCTAQVKQSLENARAQLTAAYDHLQLSWQGAIIQGRKYIPFAYERYPQYVDELMGIAEGADVSFDDITVLNAMEAVTMDALHLTKCTSFAVNGERTEDEHILVAHNEDWVPEDESDVFIIHATPENEPTFLAMTYGGLLPNIGFNAAGIAQCCDSVYPSDCRIGIPRLFVSRAVLGSQTPSEAIRHMLAPHRAAGYNHLLAHSSGELFNVEVSARHFAVLGSEDGYAVHTNHYLDPNMQEVESESDELISTRIRYFRALHLVQKSRKHSIKSIKKIQRDHVNYPDSICNHAIDDYDPLNREKTITSLIIDLTSQKMHVAWGNPCQNEYDTYDLNC